MMCGVQYLCMSPLGAHFTKIAAPLQPSPLTCYKQFEKNSNIVLMFAESQRVSECAYQQDNRVRSKLCVACQRWWFQWRFWFPAILVNCAPSGEVHNYCTPHIIKENFENLFIYRCNYALLSQVYCVWQVVKPPTIIFNNPVCIIIQISTWSGSTTFLQTST
jgi:hypothetical protein